MTHRLYKLFSVCKGSWEQLNTRTICFSSPHKLRMSDKIFVPNNEPFSTVQFYSHFLCDMTNMLECHGFLELSKNAIVPALPILALCCVLVGIFCRPRRFTALALAELRHAGAGTVHPSAGGIGKLRKALAGGFQANRAVGGVHPGCRLGEIPFLPPAHIAFSGTLHLVDLVPGVLFAVILDVPGVQLFQLVAGPRGRVAQLRKHGEKGVAAVPAAQPGAPKSGCMILPEICTDNSGKIQKRR